MASSTSSKVRSLFLRNRRVFDPSTASGVNIVTKAMTLWKLASVMPDILYSAPSNLKRPPDILFAYHSAVAKSTNPAWVR